MRCGGAEGGAASQQAGEQGHLAAVSTAQAGDSAAVRLLPGLAAGEGEVAVERPEAAAGLGGAGRASRPWAATVVWSL